MHDNLMRAKELFFYYNGNLFFMDRDGDYSEYKVYGVSKELELEWIEEIVDDKVARLSFDDILAFSNLSSIAKDYHTHHDVVNKIIKILLNFVSKNNIEGVDSLSKLICAEQLLEIPCSNKKIIKAKTERVMELLQRVISNPIYVNEKWEKNLPIEFIQEKAIRDRAYRALKRAKTIQDRFC